MASRFEPHVSFDNFGGVEPTERNINSYTLNVKHTGYKYQKRSRTFMVGIDENAYSDYALQWMLEELVDDGDEIICLRVVDRDAKISSDKSLEKKQYQDDARQLMQLIQAKNDEHRAISIVLEFAVGKVHTTFQKMVSQPISVFTQV
jgi:Universal stress protein family